MGPHSTECKNLALEEMTTAGCAASMGPHSTECGNGPEASLLGRRRCMLQWGRTQLSAEMCDCGTVATVSPMCFNGAALN